MQLTLGKIELSPTIRESQLEYFRRHSKEYRKRNIRGNGGKNGPVSLNLGFAGEHLVISWLLARQIEVAMMCNKQGPHDLVALIDGRWWTIQVKLGAVNEKTGHAKLRTPKSRIVSDIAAVVDLIGGTIRWQPLREELPTALALADLMPRH